MNYFDIFGIEPAPVVDIKKISATYFEIQRSTHPDFFMHATEVEKQEALERSSKANEGYAVFKDAQKTLEHYLKVTGAITEGEKHQLSPEFLMEMLELNDGLDDMDPNAAKEEVHKMEESIKIPVQT